MTLSRILWTSIALASVLVAGLAAKGAPLGSICALTGAALLGIFAFGSYQPLVVRLYTPETRSLHRFPAWLLVLHPTFVGLAALTLFRRAPDEAGALLAGLVVVPVAIVLVAIFQLCFPRNSNARPGSP